METETTKPVQTFREGAVGVSVWKRDGKNGAFYEFTLSRSYKKSEEEAGYTQSFREENEQALVRVVSEAAEWIREHRASNEPAASQPADVTSERQSS